MVSLEAVLASWREHVEHELAAWATRLYPTTTRFHAACRYALEGQGKRIRPLLTLAAHHACLGQEGQALIPALALEWVHTYSLVHDDLPAMDNDDLRRGRPTTHKAFDEATAMLVGDALLTDAFKLLIRTPGVSDSQRVGLLDTLAQAAGGQGMVYGQALDMQWTGRQGYRQEDLDAIHQHKTGRLIEAACTMGAWSAGVGARERELLTTFGSKIGLAFQIIDDLLDTQTAIGKTTGKDAALGKLTYLTLMSREQAEQRASALTGEALQLLEALPGDRAPLLALAHQLLQRQR